MFKVELLLGFHPSTALTLRSTQLVHSRSPAAFVGVGVGVVIVIVIVVVVVVVNFVFTTGAGENAHGSRRHGAEE